tara:strand:- start:12117 stop:13133 length:1017 start_codon:yes stop_codon:yes gene_type:complete
MENFKVDMKNNMPKKSDIFDRYNAPILSDNRNWRKDIPDYDNYFDSVAQELLGLPREDGVVTDSKIVERASCIVCGEKNYKQVFGKYGFLYVQCTNCTHVYVQNRLKDEKILEDYSGGNTLEKITHKIEKTDKLQEYAFNLYNKYLSLFSDLGLSKGNLIDIGCGSGNFVDFCVKNSSFNVFANEINEDMHDGLREIVGDNLISGPIEEQDFEGRGFDIVTLWGVLEHLIDPVSVLKKAKSITNENGYILALLPNIKSRAIKLLGARTPTLNPKVHIQMFTKKSFKLMCDDLGIKIIKMFGELPVIDLMYEYCKYDEELIKDIVASEETYYQLYLLKK